MDPIFRGEESKDNLWVPIFRGQESKDKLWVPSSGVKNPKTSYGSHLQGSRIQRQPMGPIFRGQESKETYGSHLQGSRIQRRAMGPIFRGQESKDSLWVPSSGVKNLSTTYLSHRGSRTREDGTSNLSHNVGKEAPLPAA